MSRLPVKYLSATSKSFDLCFQSRILIVSEYYSRIMLYRTRSWHCQQTGKRNLSYKEALESEKKALAKKVEAEGKMPTVWTQPALELIHYSITSLI
jgi:hypothetical protein